MTPRTMNAKICEGCGAGMRIEGEGEEEECVKIWVPG